MGSLHSDMDRHLVFIVVLNLLASLRLVEGIQRCGYQNEWRETFSTIPYDVDQGTYGDESQQTWLNATTGKFMTRETERYRVIVTAVVGGMPPPKPGDIRLNTSPVYAQIFLYESSEGTNEAWLTGNDNYLLVKEGEVANLETTVWLSPGVSLELRTGHVTRHKFSREVYNHRVAEIPGGFLEDITFCIAPMPGSD